MRKPQEHGLDSNLIVEEFCFEVFGVPLEELASAWVEELVKEATDWGSAEESAKVVEAQEMATARAVKELAAVARDRR